MVNCFFEKSLSKHRCAFSLSLSLSHFGFLFISIEDVLLIALVARNNGRVYNVCNFFSSHLLSSSQLSPLSSVLLLLFLAMYSSTCREWGQKAEYVWYHYIFFLQNYNNNRFYLVTFSNVCIGF